MVLWLKLDFLSQEDEWNLAMNLAGSRRPYAHEEATEDTIISVSRRELQASVEFLQRQEYDARARVIVASSEPTLEYTTSPQRECLDMSSCDLSSIQTAGLGVTPTDGYEDRYLRSTDSIAQPVLTACVVATALIDVDVPVSNPQSNNRQCHSLPFGIPHEPKKRAVFSLLVTNTLRQW